ncbi:hypothetical protein Lal_00024038 [Lupinus albus]|uniref:Uncharacterized protein n=1 Tax=Lupinus albus TaxID=3870 RepID=A0A6A4PHX8_LUPAL|nr:hypothetical protein Lalb_Chr13g0293951 [Lupinus albus]KAF1888026.1 hypothetical protein Lal_00024038 [Lupinus albus]
MADTIVMPTTTYTSITNANICPSINETSPLTPFCAISPHCMVSVRFKIQIQIALETIYEEEEYEDDDDEMEKNSDEMFVPSSPLIFTKHAAITTCSFKIKGHLMPFGHKFPCA